MLTQLAAMLAATPLFASRAFVPAFAAALLLRFGPEYGITADAGVLAVLGVGANPPAWFTGDLSLILLGVLAGLEVAATKQADARAALDEITPWIKPAMMVATLLGWMDAADAPFVESVVPEVATADIGMLGVLLAGGAAIAVFVLARAKAELTRLLFAIDEDDDLGLQRLLSWGEDIFSFGGMVLVVLLPLLMLVLAGLGVAGLWVVRRTLAAREDARRVPCGSCGERMYGAALACPACAAVNPEPRRLGWLGVASERAAGDDQPMRLLAHRRCPRCAERLPGHDPTDACRPCGREPMLDGGGLADYDACVRRRFPVVMLLVIGCAMVPVVGLIPAILIGRLGAVAPYRRHVPRGRAMVIRFGMRLLVVLAIALQWVPGMGPVLIGAMTWANHAVYRRALRGAVEG
ncbi:MAG: hypothetical protein AB8G96_12595 [Phycisphaerales bacterium]